MKKKNIHGTDDKKARASQADSFMNQQLKSITKGEMTLGKAKASSNNTGNQSATGNGRSGQAHSSGTKPRYTSGALGKTGLAGQSSRNAAYGNGVGQRTTM